LLFLPPFKGYYNFIAKIRFFLKQINDDAHVKSPFYMDSGI
jgi:hypothetical protein